MTHWSATWRHPEFRRGAQDMFGVALGIGAWGLVTGVVMVKAGLSPWLAMLMTLFVFSGSAQLAALPLMIAGAPIGLILLTAFCVNLRFVILSAQWRPYWTHLSFAQRAWVMYFATDVCYIVFVRRHPEPALEPTQRAAQTAYYWGNALLCWVAWQSLSLVGIVFAQQVPTSWGLGFAGVLALLGIVCSMLVDRASWVAAAVAGVAAMVAYALPLKLNIVVAIVASVAVGMAFDAAHARKRLVLDKPT